MPKMQSFSGGTDIQRSLNLADNKCINLYPTIDDKGQIVAFYTTPGLIDYATIPAGQIASGIYTASNGRCFIVAATTLYEITTGGILTVRGTVTAGTVTRFTDNGIDMILVNGTDGWLLKFATNVLTKITSVGFPNGAKTISYMNGRFAALQPNTQNFFVSDVLDGYVWDALNVQTVDSNPDMVIGAIVSHNEYIVFGAITGEVFYDSGAVVTPWVRNVSGIFEVGCVAPYSISKIDNSVMWLGSSTTGYGIVYRLNGYTPTRVSTMSIEYAIQQMSVVTDAISFTYQQDGHHFYVLTFPIGGRTFVYDCNTQVWHERAGFIDGSFIRWEAQEYAFFDNQHLVCDTLEGKIYYLDLAAYTDGGKVRKWVRSWRAPGSDMKREKHHRLTLELEGGVGTLGGVDQSIVLRYSNDGGHTWSNELWRDLGAMGEYQKRVYWHRLGITSGQPRVYELSGSANVKTVLISAYIE